MAPRVGLTYSSQAPIYGTIASGWSLALPAILEDTSQGRLRTRSPEVENKQCVNNGIGEQCTINAIDDDRFISTMAGSRPLVKVTEPTSTDVEASGVRVGFTYRAQNDSSYTRYERMSGVSTPPTSGQYHWRAYTSAGVVMKFGETDRMGNCPYLGHGYAPLTSETDSFGNTVIYEWGLAVSVDIGDCAIKRITWGMNAAAGITQPFAKVVFGWTAPNAYSGFAVGGHRDYRTGKKVITGASRLSTITVTAFAPGAESSPEHTRLITLGYKTDEEAVEVNGAPVQHAPVRLLETIQESAWGTGLARVDLPPVKFDYASAKTLLTAPTSPPPLPPWSIGLHPTPHRFNLGWGYRRTDGRWPSVEEIMVDLDGDSLPDRLTNTSGRTGFTSCTAPARQARIQRRPASSTATPAGPSALPIRPRPEPGRITRIWHTAGTTPTQTALPISSLRCTATSIGTTSAAATWSVSRGQRLRRSESAPPGPRARAARVRSSSAAMLVAR